jgi:hypothetical protein
MRVAHRHPEGPAGHLRPDGRAGRVGGVHRREPVPPVVWILFVDHRQEGERYQELPPGPGDPLDLGVGGVALVAASRAAHSGRNHLQHNGTHVGDDGHPRGEFVLFGVGARHGFTRCAAMSRRAPERHA